MLLRGGQEHRELRISQLKRLQNPDRYVYYKNASKNRPGGLMQSNLDHKVVSIVANPAVGDGCHISILDKYLMKCHQLHMRRIFFIVSRCQVFQLMVLPSASRKKHIVANGERYVLRSRSGWKQNKPFVTGCRNKQSI